MTDFDGEQLPEKKLAAKYGVRFTPTFQFFPSDLAAIKALPPPKREVARAPGYLQARRLPRHVPLRAREGLREGQLPGISSSVSRADSKQVSRSGFLPPSRAQRGLESFDLGFLRRGAFSPKDCLPMPMTAIEVSSPNGPKATRARSRF